MNDTPDRIGPTPERMARAIGEDGKPMITEIELGSDNVNWKAHRLNDAPLGRLRFCERPKISADQFAAGEAYYAVVYYAGMMTSGVVDPGRVVVDGGRYKHTPDRLIAAKAKYEKIIKRMDYPIQHIVDAIVVQEIKLAEYAERFRSFPERRVRQAVALDRLQRGLDWLASHFGIGSNPGGTIVASVGERPTIQPSAQQGSG